MIRIGRRRRGAQKAYTDKAKAVGADAALAIQPEESYRTVFKQAQEGIRGIYAEHEAGGKAHSTRSKTTAIPLICLVPYTSEKRHVPDRSRTDERA